MQGVRTVVIEEIDDSHCRHSVEGEIVIKVFGVGKLAERTIIDSTIKTFQALPAIVERCAGSSLLIKSSPAKHRCELHEKRRMHKQSLSRNRKGCMGIGQRI